MTRFATLLLLLVLSTPAFADNWPQWRGPSGQGFCEEKNIPLTWSDKENVKWKVELENQGNSTPVIWKSREAPSTERPIRPAAAARSTRMSSVFC